MKIVNKNGYVCSQVEHIRITTKEILLFAIAIKIRLEFVITIYFGIYKSFVVRNQYLLPRPAIPVIRFSTDLFVTIMGKIGSYILHQFVEIICILKIKRR